MTLTTEPQVHKIAAGAPDRWAPARLARGTRVAVTFPETSASDAETVTGTVVAADHDSIDIRRDDNGETFTLFDIEMARGTVQVEVIG